MLHATQRCQKAERFRLFFRSRVAVTVLLRPSSDPSDPTLAAVRRPRPNIDHRMFGHKQAELRGRCGKGFLQVGTKLEASHMGVVLGSLKTCKF